MKNFEITADFLFDQEVEYNGVTNRTHQYIGTNISTDFVFVGDKFQLLDIIVNGNSVKEHVQKSVLKTNTIPFTSDIFNTQHSNLKFTIHECEWLCHIGPFSRWKIAGDPSSGKSDTFYYITWFGHSRPGTNVVVNGKQFITHNQKILDKWIVQKKMHGTPGEARTRIFFVPPFEYVD
jgi:hypothetical protein